MEPRLATAEEVTLVHDAEHFSRVASTSRLSSYAFDADTPVSSRSFETACLAAGGVLTLLDAVMAGEIDNGFAFVRPPGHHAEPNRAMGFCLFNNVAIGAAYLRERHGLKRILVMDWDVHHGNGTQHAFEEDPTVYYMSLHQWPLYPGTGRADERGRGAGTGATLNCPMEPGDGDDAYIRVFEEQILPELERFAPGAIIVSAGFDAHAADPLSATRVSATGYRRMTRLLAELAASTSGGRILSLLEGGYDLEALAASVQVHLEELRTAPGC
jgi:acetoin utilization deacetylase AcuC-like enzyme